MASTRVTLRSASRLFALLIALAAAAALSASPALADPATGTATLDFAKQGKASSLAGQGVKVKVVGGKGGNLILRDLRMGNPVVVTATGKLRFTHRKRSAVFSKLTFQVKPRATTLSGKLGKRNLAIFRAAGKAEIGPDTLRLPKASLNLTGKAAKALRAKLGLEALRAGPVGKFGVDAKLGKDAPAPPPAEVKLAPKDNDIAPLPYPYASECPVGAAAGNPGFGKAPGKIPGVAPEPSFGATSQPVIGTALDWGFKHTFRKYVLEVPKFGSLQTLEGATAHPDGASMATLGSFFSFPASGGSYEAGSEPDHSDDKLVADGTGTVLFCKSGHGFNVVLKNPTVTIDGEQSRITADVGVNQNGTWYPFQRADIATLDVSGVEPEFTESENAVTWEDVPATLTADGAAAMGIYKAGEELDPITVEATVPKPIYPFASQCAVQPVEGGGGFAHPPGPVAGILPEPTFDPGGSVSLSGTTVDWGFKFTFRNYVVNVPAPPGGLGSVHALDGAGLNPNGPNMGLPASFIDFPVLEGTYQEGDEPNHSDDLLVAHGTGTALFCRAGHGFNIALRDPTVTIDGAQSRITADVGANINGTWYPFQRADIAALDVTGIEPQESGETLTWSGVPAELTADGATASGLYEAGEELDDVRVSVELPEAP